MPGIPVLKPREVIAILNALGFVEVRQRGSHNTQLRLHLDRPAVLECVLARRHGAGGRFVYKLVTPRDMSCVRRASRTSVARNGPSALSTPPQRESPCPTCPCRHG